MVPPPNTVLRAEIHIIFVYLNYNIQEDGVMMCAL